MPVFISHRSADDDKAQSIGWKLKRRGILCYLDHFDPSLRPARHITALLVDRIRACTHLMALITNATRNSWWVPFEVGVAREAPRRISSYDYGTARLPEFLTEWPVLSSDADLDAFATAYHRDVAGKPFGERRAAQDIRTPGQFHAVLKAALGQH